MHPSAFFVSVIARCKKMLIFRLKLDLVDGEDVLLENNEYSVRVLGLISF